MSFLSPTPRPSEEERFAAINEALAPHGFMAQYQAGADEILRRFLPVKEFSAVEEFGSSVRAQIDGRDVGVAEYRYSTTDQEGNTSWSTTHVAVVLDPNIVGTASIVDDWKAGTGGKILNAALWIPPFTIVKAIQLLFDSKNLDHQIGDATFDNRYKVHAETPELASHVFHPAFREAILQMDFHGALEVRHGALIFSVKGAGFDPAGLMRTLGHVPLLIAGALNRTAATYR